jgi:hypothetical protein
MHKEEIQKRLEKTTGALERLLKEMKAVGFQTAFISRAKPILDQAYNLAFEEKLYKVDDVYSLAVYVLRKKDRLELLRLVVEVELNLRCCRRG